MKRAVRREEEAGFRVFFLPDLSFSRRTANVPKLSSFYPGRGETKGSRLGCDWWAVAMETEAEWFRRRPPRRATVHAVVAALYITQSKSPSSTFKEKLGYVSSKAEVTALSVRDLKVFKNINL